MKKREGSDQNAEVCLKLSSYLYQVFFGQHLYPETKSNCTDPLHQITEHSISFVRVFFFLLLFFILWDFFTPQSLRARRGPSISMSELALLLYEGKKTTTVKTIVLKKKIISNTHLKFINRQCYWVCLCLSVHHNQIARQYEMRILVQHEQVR